ncbi:hypothetical protein CesoFtcFv8_011871 [Champsocephalus esox]|uniref:Proteolipid protein 2 n=1 Tax=Champsocephalus esox TaxID=159716 RepID=A0AAN8GX67_9TELE|nr:hypothetical protein CesoFtcFv8_011871 [Champsocephalus esox]
MGDTDAASTGADCLPKLKSYVNTQKGKILAAEIVVSLIVIICFASSHYGGYSTVAICKMISSILFFVIFMMEIDKQILVINWVWTDLIRALIGTVLYFIVSLVSVIGGSGDGARIAAGVFGLIAALLFAYDTYTIFLHIKSTRQHTAASTEERI